MARTMRQHGNELCNSVLTTPEKTSFKGAHYLIGMISEKLETHEHLDRSTLPLATIIRSCKTVQIFITHLGSLSFRNLYQLLCITHPCVVQWGPPCQWSAKGDQVN